MLFFLRRRPSSLLPSHLNQGVARSGLWAKYGHAYVLSKLRFCRNAWAKYLLESTCPGNPKTFTIWPFKERSLPFALSQCCSKEVSANWQEKELEAEYNPVHCFLHWETLVSKNVRWTEHCVQNCSWFLFQSKSANRIWVSPIWPLMSSKVQLKSHNCLWPPPPTRDSCCYSSYY